MILPIRIGLIATSSSATPEQIYTLRDGLVNIAALDDDEGNKKFFVTLCHDDNPGALVECLERCTDLYDELEAFPSILRQANIPSTVRHAPIRPRERHDILVRSIQYLIAIVKEEGFTNRSETWRTIWKAVESHCPVVVVFPDGEARMYK